MTDDAQGWRSWACRAERMRRRMRGPPIRVRLGRRYLADHHIDHAVDQLVLVGDVLVEGHRHDPQRLGAARMLSASMPSASAKATAACMTRALLRGVLP